ncbi:MAG TPA: hypothetical protein VKB26_15550 [Candidatus Acidoferrales bacterium]|nr:hypothetical protein [Candidatus Acidoferrales bacterium]
MSKTETTNRGIGELRPCALFRLRCGGPEGYMSIRRKWLRVIFLMMLAGSCFFGAISPKDIENTLNVMNETKVEFSLPDENDSGDDGPEGHRAVVEIPGRKQGHTG